MPKKALTDEQKSFIVAERDNVSPADLAKNMFGIGERTVAKYIATLTTITTPKSNDSPVTTIKAQEPEGHAVMDAGKSAMVDTITKSAVLDLTGKACAINPSKPLPKNVILD